MKWCKFWSIKKSQPLRRNNWNMEMAVAKPGFVPGWNGDFYSLEILLKGGLYFQWSSVTHHHLTFLSISGPPSHFIHNFGLCKEGLEASYSWERKRFGETGFKDVMWNFPQLLVFNAAHCMGGTAALEGVGRLESCFWGFLGKPMDNVDFVCKDGLGRASRSLFAPLARAEELQLSPGAAGLCSQGCVQGFTAHGQYHMEWGEMWDIHGWDGKLPPDLPPVFDTCACENPFFFVVLYSF